MDVFWKKVVVYSVLVVLAVPLIFFMAKNLEHKRSKFSEAGFLEKLNLSEVKQEMKEVNLEEIKESGEELEKLFAEISTSTTSTDNY